MSQGTKASAEENPKTHGQTHIKRVIETAREVLRNNQGNNSPVDVRTGTLAALVNHVDAQAAELQELKTQLGGSNASRQAKHE